MIYWPVDYTYPFLLKPSYDAPIVWRTATMPNYKGHYTQSSLYWDLVYLLEYFENAAKN